MINKIAQKLTHYYIMKQDIETEEIEKYNYCFEILLATIINVLALILLSLIFHRFIETILYLVVFAVLRSQTGGYHAKTHFGCILVSVINCLIMFCVLEYMNINSIKLFTYISVPCCLIIISLLAPIESENKPLGEHAKRKGAVLSIIISSIITCLNVLAIVFKNYNLVLLLSFSILSITISIVVGYINNKKRRETYD